jgi:hypothetical protein
MKLNWVFVALAVFITSATAAIMENGHLRETNYPDTRIDPSAYAFTDYPPEAKELSYKGRWDSKYISWWS